MGTERKFDQRTIENFMMDKCQFESILSKFIVLTAECINTKFSHNSFQLKYLQILEYQCRCRCPCPCPFSPFKHMFRLQWCRLHIFFIFIDEFISEIQQRQYFPMDACDPMPYHAYMHYKVLLSSQPHEMCTFFENMQHSHSHSLTSLHSHSIK